MNHFEQVGLVAIDAGFVGQHLGNSADKALERVKGGADIVCADQHRNDLGLPGSHPAYPAQEVERIVVVNPGIDKAVAQLTQAQVKQLDVAGADHAAGDTISKADNSVGHGCE